MIAIDDWTYASIVGTLGRRAIVLVGMPYSGKTTVGDFLAHYLSIDFKDSDRVLEDGYEMSVSDIIDVFGEPVFRQSEEKVISRLLRDGPRVLATGGGAFTENAASRARIKARSLSIWLKSDEELLLERFLRRPNRPLLKSSRDPRAKLKSLIAERNPIFAKADMIVDVGGMSPSEITLEILKRHDEMKRILRTKPMLADIGQRAAVAGDSAKRNADAQTDHRLKL